jgi:hypothetical protein
MMSTLGQLLAVLSLSHAASALKAAADAPHIMIIVIE